MSNKLLYVENLETPTVDILSELLSNCDLSIEEVIILSINSLKELSKNLTNRGIKCRIFIKKSLSASGILNLADREDVSFIVIHLDKNTGTSLRASIAKKIIRGSSVPALIVDQNDGDTEKKTTGIFEHVIFPTDWSPESENALRYMFNFKEAIKEIEIVNVINHKLTAGDIRNLKERLIKTRKLCLNEGIDAEFHIYAGKTSEEIITAAKDYKASAIIIGARYKSIFDGFFLKNVPYSVLEKTSVPTLVVI